MAPVSIHLPPELTAQHLEVAIKYFEQTRRLSPQEWRLVFETFDVLGRAFVQVGRRRMSFREIYERYVDRRYADIFLNQLMNLEGNEADALQQQSAFDMLAGLESEAFYTEEVSGSEYLAAYCLYWWSAFTRGYQFEWKIFRDLADSGIEFTHHDLRRRSERRSPYDLIVMQQLGDVKSTTYFLYSARSLPLNCDFYITRLYARRRYIIVVMMTDAAWHELNGEVTAASLERAANHFPDPVQIRFDEQTWVIAPYDLWKTKVRERQQKEG